MVLGRLAGGGEGILDSTGSGEGLVASCCECGDERSSSCIMDLSLLDSSLIDVYRMSNLSDFFMKACTMKSPERYFRFSEWPA
jgi:hypothetical protein